MTGSPQRAAGLQLAGALQLGGLLAVAGLLIGVGSAYDPRYPLLAIAGVALVVVSMANLTYGVVALTLVAFFERTPGLADVPLSKPLGLVLVVSWLAALARRGSQIPLLFRDEPVVAALLVALVAWGAASASWAADPGAAISSAARLAMVVVLFFIVYSAVQDVRDLRLVTWAFLLGAFLIAATSLATGQTVEGRLSGGALDPNFLSAALASSIGVAILLVWSAKPSAQALLLVCVAVDATALVLTQSRGGLIATAAALLAACALAGPVRTQTVAVAVVVASLGLAYFAVVAPASVRARVTNVSAQASASRTDTWQIALRAAGDHPLTGVGIGSFPAVEASYMPGDLALIRAKEVLSNRLVVHNTYLELLSELGVPGLALFLAAVAATLGIAWRGLATRRGAGARRTIVVRGLLAGTVGLLVAYVFLSGEYEKQLWLLLGLLAATGNVMRASPADRP